MTVENVASLRARLEAFPFDTADSPGAFAAKLVRENGWGHDFAERAIAEYRRYLILAGAAGHAVSPSEVIDAVWHQHLLFTRSYWDELCRDVLKFPLHHEPSRGGGAEKAKYDDWYAKTYESYRRIFGEDPPADIWPTPAQRVVDRSKFVRIDVSRNWVLPKFNVAQWAAVAVVMLAIVALAAGCERAATPQAAVSSMMGSVAGSHQGVVLAAAAWNPFDFTGGQFLIFYALAFVAACIAAAIFRRNALSPAIVAPARSKADLDPYEIAYLNGGGRLVVNAAIAHLIAQKHLKFDPQTRLIGATSGDAAQSRGLHEVERALLTHARVPAAVSQVHQNLEPAVAKVRSTLQQSGLLAEMNAARSAQVMGLALTLGVVAVGLIKLFVGLSRDKPVGYLIVLLVISTIVAFAFFARRPERTARGRELLGSVRARHREAEAGPAVAAGTMSAAMAMAMFGPSILGVSPELDAFRQSIRETKGAGAATTGCGGSSCGSSCGSSDSSGGSSCGSSGCGGCGGGGGD